MSNTENRVQKPRRHRPPRPLLPSLNPQQPHHHPNRWRTAILFPPLQSLPFPTHQLSLSFTQLTLLKEHYIDAFAARFQAAGFSALIYDHRRWGSSDGELRHESDLWIQADDYHEAITFASTLLSIDPSRICIWGAGHSGGYVMLAGALDPRVKVVVTMVPLISGEMDSANFPAGTLQRAWEDRAKRGSEMNEAGKADVIYVPVWSSTRAQALAEGNTKRMIGLVEAFDYYTAVKSRSDAAGTPWSNLLSTRSFINLEKWEPRAYIHRIAPKPLLYGVVEQDKFIPLKAQLECFERAGSPKELVRLEGSEHLDTYSGVVFEENVGRQIEFLRKWL